MSRPALTLKQFLLRQQVMKLYIDFHRTIRKLPETEREEMRSWVRQDFKRNMYLDPEGDQETIKAMLLNGEKMLREMKQSAELAKA